MCEQSGMTVTELRKGLGLSLEDFARLVGLSSKGQMSEIERDGKCSVRVALEIERVSEGRISASQLSSDVALVEQARASQAAA